MQVEDQSSSESEDDSDQSENADVDKLSRVIMIDDS